MMNDILKKQIELLPDQPGCYLMHNADDEIIYIGKAKNLKKRVSQYFLRVHSGKTAAMVSHVDHFETIITKSEKEALILEMNLIQKNHPRYNILLMDDKHYPYIAIHKNVENPYVSLSRNVKDKKCLYFGPYPNSSAAFEVIDLINKLFPLRKCHNVPKSPCLYYHIGQCLAPCVKPVSKEKYEEIVDNIADFLTIHAGLEPVKCRQGYSKCAVCVVDSGAIITADRGIAAASKEAGLDVLLISPEGVSLGGFDCGFIGGAAFKISREALAFTGRLDKHPDREAILSFLDRYKVEPLYLTESPIFDIGSGLAITEKTVSL